MAPLQLSQDQAKAIGRRLRQARRRAGYFRQEALAEAADLSLSYISKLESGHLVPKDDQVYRDLAALVQVSRDWLLEGQTETVTARREAPAAPPDTLDLRQVVQHVHDLLQDAEAYQALETLASKQQASIVDILVSLVRATDSGEQR